MTTPSDSDRKEARMATPDAEAKAPQDIARSAAEEIQRGGTPYYVILGAITEALDAQRERDAKIADEERDCAATDAYDDRQALGAQYDPNCYGTGYDAGRKAAAEQIAAAIRSQGKHRS